MQDPVLHVMAIVVLVIDLLILIGALCVSYILIRYRYELYMLYQWLQAMRNERKKTTVQLDTSCYDKIHGEPTKA